MCFGFSLTNYGDIDWSALLGRPRAVRIAWVRPAQGAGNAQYPNHYQSLHWRLPHVNGIRFAELDSYDIRGLSAMIQRTIQETRIRYILGATGKGRRQLRRSPMLPISWVEYVFIDSDETARAWLLSNPVLDDPLDLLVYCDRVNRDGAVTRAGATPPQRRNEYLPIDAVDYWANSPAARIGQMHVRAPEPDVDDGDGQSDSDRQADAAAERQEQDASHFPQGKLSGSLSAPDVTTGHEGSVRSLPSPVGDDIESAAKRIPLAVKSLNRLSTQESSEFRRDLTRDGLVRKRGAESDPECSDERKSRRLRLGSIAREILNRKERKRGAQFDEERKAKRLRASFAGRV